MRGRGWEIQTVRLPWSVLLELNVLDTLNSLYYDDDDDDDAGWISARDIGLYNLSIYLVQWDFHPGGGRTEYTDSKAVRETWTNLAHSSRDAHIGLGNFLRSMAIRHHRVLSV